MNTLIVDNKDDISDIIVTEDMYIKINLNDIGSIINIDVMENQNLMVFEINNNTTNNITYNLRDGANVIVNKICVDCNDVTNIKISGNNASITYITSLVSYKDNEYVQNIYHYGSGSTSTVINHGINANDKKLSFVINGNIDKDSIGSNLKQDNKIINLDNGESFIHPNLIVDNNDVVANHGAYIGSFNEEVLFYLKTRGLSDKDCNYLLIKGFMLSNMALNEEELEEALKIIDNI